MNKFADDIRYKVTLFEKDASPEERLRLLAKGEKRYSSWYISQKEFAPILEKLRKEPPGLTKEEGLINESSGKYVWKVDFEMAGEKRIAAYKTNPGKTPYRYIFQSSLPIREMRNYLHFEAVGLPVVEVLAAGDVRKNFILKETFIVTAFLEGSEDGRVFMPGGSRRKEGELRRMFCRKNMELLAKLHNGSFFHKAFHPRNLLFRGSEKDLEIFWIDVARCRKVSGRKMPWSIVKDLHTFFRDMLLPKEEVLSLLAHYLAFAPKGFLPEEPQALLEELIHFRRHLFVKKSYKLFGEE